MMARNATLRIFLFLLLVDGLSSDRATATEVPWASTPVDASGSQQIRLADVNSDGLLDVVSVESDTLLWYENQGHGGFSPRTIVSTTASNTTFAATSAADADGDGDVDVFLTTITQACAGFVCITVISTIEYENTFGDGMSWEPSEFIGTAPSLIADIDGNGILDPVITLGGERISWVNTNLGIEFTIQEGAFIGPVRVEDIDGDCDNDVVALSQIDGVVWFENLNGLGTAWTQHVITSVPAENALHLTDIDHDGWIDAVVDHPADNSLHWYQNPRSTGLWSGQPIDLQAGVVRMAAAGDFDLNDRCDLMAVVDDGETVVWYENLDGLGIDWTRRIVSDSASDTGSAQVGDLDGDQRPDIVITSANEGIQWLENRLIGRSAEFSSQMQVSSAAQGVRSIDVADLDMDGDLDVLSASPDDSTIRWFESNGATSPAFITRTIDSSASGVVAVRAGDLNGDGYADVVAALEPLDDIVWFENDGTPSFGSWSSQTIAIGAAGVRALDAGDIDCDGDVDVISADYDAGLVRLWRNDGANSPGFVFMNVSTVGGGPSSVAIVDYDQDGDADVISAWEDEGALKVHDNANGTGSVWSTITLATGLNRPTDVFATDLDGDGDPDVAIAEGGDCLLVFPFTCSGAVSWFENGADTLHDIDLDSPRAMSISASDLDLDGDQDILVTSASTSFGQANCVHWYNNLGGPSTGFAKGNVACGVSVAQPFDVASADLDGDGDPEVLSAISGTDTVAWYRNTGGQFGIESLSIAPPTLVAMGTSPLFKLDLVHNGRIGDGDAEFFSFELLFEGANGIPPKSARRARADPRHRALS